VADVFAAGLVIVVLLIGTCFVISAFADFVQERFKDKGKK